MTRTPNPDSAAGIPPVSRRGSRANASQAPGAGATLPQIPLREGGHQSQLRAFSYGGGWQSNAALVLAAEGKIDYRTFVFCNVGEDSENPGTLEYVEKHAKPYAAAHGLEFIELRKIRRNGEPDTILQWVERSERSIPIPVRMANGAPGNRSCTVTFKIEVVAKWARKNGASEDNPAVIGIGFTVDEIGRVGGRPPEPGTVKDYPLLGLGLRRKDIPDILRAAGLPLPPKSACWFCAEKRESQWITQRHEEPELFAKSCDLEAMLNRRRETLGKDHVFFTRFGKPLDKAIPDGIQPLFDTDDGECESGYCFT